LRNILENPPRSDQHFSQRSLAFDVIVSFRRALQRINAINGSANVASRARGKGPVEVAHVHSRRADNLKPSDVKPFEIELDIAAAMGAATHQTASLRDTSQRERPKIRIAAALEYQIGTAPVCQRHNLFHEIAAAIVDRGVGAKLARERCAIVGAGNGYDCRSRQVCDLDGESAERAGSTEDKNGLSGA
jgi:hypothetical protein